MTEVLMQTETLPKFSEINIEDIVPALDKVLTKNRAEIDELLKQERFTWDTLMAPLEKLGVRLNHMWSPVGHMNSVVNSDELRKVYETCLQKLSEYSSELGQNTKLYHAIKSIADGPDFDSLSLEQKKIIENEIRDFILAGVSLDDDSKERYREIKARLSELSNQFSNHVLDATQAWHYHTEAASELAGLPESALAQAKALAAQKDLSGYVITLDIPSYLPAMMYLESRQLRETLYQAYSTIASDEGPNAGKFDNTQIMHETLALRHELAKLLGFSQYAEVSLETKMAANPDEVLGFLKDLAKRSRPQAEKEFSELESFAKTLGVEQLQPWDVPYVSEKLKQVRFSVSQEAFRPYFPEDTVLSGMFEIIHRLYGIKVTEQQNVDVWHKDVRFFELTDENGFCRGQFYLDLYARQHKRGGAWMDECRIRHHLNEDLQVPVAYLTCNFSNPVDGKPALFTHDEVITLFHETGHGLHHMLTKIDLPSVSGINGVPWDAVELPSQFFENWCWEEEALGLISGHYETGEPIPADMLNNLRQAKNFQSAMQMVRQLEFSLFDFRIHSEFDLTKGDQIQSILDEVRSQVAVIIPPKFNRFQHAFGHIFAGGYAAGYYSYKWAEVLASDAYSAFEENGIFDKATGRHFLTTILEQGGSKEPMALFEAFRGRKPSLDALLRHSGIAA